MPEANPISPVLRAEGGAILSPHPHLFLRVQFVGIGHADDRGETNGSSRVGCGLDGVRCSDRLRRLARGIYHASDSRGGENV